MIKRNYFLLATVLVLGQAFPSVFLGGDAVVFAEGASPQAQAANIKHFVHYLTTTQIGATVSENVKSSLIHLATDSPALEAVKEKIYPPIVSLDSESMDPALAKTATDEGALGKKYTSIFEKYNPMQVQLLIQDNDDLTNEENRAKAIYKVITGHEYSSFVYQLDLTKADKLSQNQENKISKIIDVAFANKKAIENSQGGSNVLLPKFNVVTSNIAAVNAVKTYVDGLVNAKKGATDIVLESAAGESGHFMVTLPEATTKVQYDAIATAAQVGTNGIGKIILESGKANVKEIVDAVNSVINEQSQETA